MEEAAQLAIQVQTCMLCTHRYAIGTCMFLHINKHENTCMHVHIYTPSHMGINSDI